MKKTSSIGSKMALTISSAMIAVAMAAIPKAAYCWDGVGHQITTQIAYDQLKPGVKTQVNALITALANDPDVIAVSDEHKPYNFVTAGCWMDDLRSIDRQFSSWHYSDLPIDGPLTSDDVAKFMDANPNNNVHAIETFCLPTLKDTSASTADRARALAFFIHLAGDIHQPLHAVGVDAGGNKYAIDPVPSADPTWQIKNLHSFWDNAYRYSGKHGQITIVVSTLDIPRITAPGQDPIRSLASEIEKDYAPTDSKLASDDNCADWGLESRNIAATFVYPKLNGSHTLTADYVQQSHDIACRRLELAGLRIANTLNNIFSGQSAVAASHLNPIDTGPEKTYPDQSSVASTTATFSTVASASQDVIGALKPADSGKALNLADHDASVTGTVTQTYSPESHAMVVLDFDSDYMHTITAIVRPDSYSKLPDLKALEGKQLLVTGKVSNYHGRAQIIVTDPSQIRVVQ